MLSILIGLLSIIVLIAGIIFAINNRVEAKREKSTRKAMIGLILNGLLLLAIFITAADRRKKAGFPKESSFYNEQDSSGFI